MDQVDDPIVWALDSKWGAGKSFFLKQWVGAHTRQNSGRATTVYFDAFTSDYLSDPLLSLIAAVGLRIDAQYSGTFETLQNIASSLLRPSINIGLSVLTAGLSQYFSSALDALNQTAGDEVKNATQQLWTAELNREEDMKSFKTLLAKVA